MIIKKKFTSFKKVIEEQQSLEPAVEIVDVVEQTKHRQAA